MNYTNHKIKLVELLRIGDIKGTKICYFAPSDDDNDTGTITWLEHEADSDLWLLWAAWDKDGGRELNVQSEIGPDGEVIFTDVDFADLRLREHAPVTVKPTRFQKGLGL
jgi:hypothetical protein